MASANTEKLNMDGILLFEQPTIKVPYENLRKAFRSSQKHVEREMNAVQSVASDLVKRTEEDYDALETLKVVDSMIAKVEGLKTKLTSVHTNATIPAHSVIRERLEHINALDAMTLRTDPAFDSWAETRLNRWLVDWALRSGREETARKLAQTQKIESLVDVDLFTEIRRIEDALRRRSCTEALAWCAENKPALRKIKNTLEFDLRYQEFIELSRQRKLNEAFAYMRKHLLPWQETHFQQIMRACGMILYPDDTRCGPYKRLYDESRWSNLVNDFRLACYTLHSLPSESLLSYALYAGLASLKLPACLNPDHRHPDCPVCDREGPGQLATEVPFSHHDNSSIVCKITGKIMNSDNWPMAFPNGYVYSREALEDMAAKNDGMVTCPRTGLRVPFTDLRKVFIS